MRFLPSHTVSAPSVHITYPRSSLWNFPPPSLPESLPPPVSDWSYLTPFNIDPVTYNKVLSVWYPIIAASLYVITVALWGRVNQERGHKPWAFSRTRIFYIMVLLHNILLAIYSAWTFVGMTSAIVRSWPGLRSADGLPGVVDALCKINGPRGLGNAVSFNSTTSSWGVTNKLIQLLDDSPDNTDVGRIWNEGLAFYGWLFYLSKFYEVVDTLIILTKGKKTSVLQTYHHAGAMFSMWAGIRYMAPPIWLFVVANSFVHSLMYTYYTITALGYRVPLTIKRGLTTLQISQFVVGVAYALAHLFIAYNVPVSTPYLFGQKVASALPSVTSSLSSVVASATATASADLAAWLKKIALRAAQQEGLAENVRYQGHRFGIDQEHAANVDKQREETRYRLEYPQVHCLDTSGQVFAILLNVMYLFPLLVLFIQFFIRSYTARTSSANKHPSHHPIKKAVQDAYKGVEREATSSDLSDMSPKILEGSVDDLKSSTKESYDTVVKKTTESYEYAGSKVSDTYQYTQANVAPKIEEMRDSMLESYENIQSKVEPMVQDFREEFVNDYETASNRFWEGVQDIFRRGSKVSTDAAKKAQDAVNTAVDNASDLIGQSGEKIQAGREKAEPVIKEKASTAADEAKEATANANDIATNTSQKISDAQQSAKSVAEDAAAKATDKTNEITDTAANKVQEGKQKGAKKAKDTADKAQEVASDANDKAAEKVDERAGDIKDIMAKAENRAHEVSEQINKGADKLDDGEHKDNDDVDPLERLKSESGQENGTDGDIGDAALLEASIDEIESPEEKKAEAEMEGTES